MSMKSSLPAAAVCAAALVLAGVNRAAAQTATNGALPAPLTVIPATVTVATGDTGGKFFGRPPDAAKTRRYFIAAEPELWDYAPQGLDPVCGKPLPPNVAAKRRGGRIRYVQYTDDTFQAKVIEAPRLGVLGPVLRGTVGEFLSITFLNRGGRPLSMHPHGVKYDKDSEGSYYMPKPGLGAAVGVGAKFTYVWHLDEESGPLPTEPSSKGWLYHSHVEGDEEAEMGLVGFIVVTDPKRARPDGTPSDIDREMAALFMFHDESGIGAAMKEALEYGNLGMNMPQLTWTQIQEQTETGARAAINGYVFGNLPGLDMNEGDRVRWYLFGLGSREDFHTAHWHGLRVLEEGRRRTDSVELLPASMKTADMVADNPGQWLFHCHVSEHMLEGMFARVTVYPRGVKGASREAAQAFFGLPSAQQSLQIKRAEATPVAATGGRASCELRLEGTVTVFQAFSVFTQPVEFQVGGKTIPFKPDRRGNATTPEGTFRAKNASQFGVVYGGMMEFEATINSVELWAELQKAGVKPGSDTPVPLTMRVGPAQHTATVPVTVKEK
jgi:FtsP/CotA-like multicopper oxidase with cupredoxin domain